MNKIFFSHHVNFKQVALGLLAAILMSLSSQEVLASDSATDIQFTQCVMSQYVSGGSLAQYSMVISTGDCVIDEDLGVFRSSDEGFVATISLFAASSTDANPQLPEGTYTMASDVAEGIWYNDAMYNVFTSYTKQDGTQSQTPSEGSLTVSQTDDGKTEIEGSLVSNGVTYNLHFVGTIEFYNDQTGTVISDPMDALFVEAQAVLTADDEGYTLVRLEMADTYANGEGTYQSGTNLLKAVVCCPLMSSSDASKYELMDGTYSVSYSLGDYVLCPGYDDGVNMPEGSYAVMVNGSASLLGMIGDGTLTVSHSDGVYSISANLLTAEDVSIKGVYNGELPFLDIRGFSNINQSAANDISPADWSGATVLDVQGRVVGQWDDLSQSSNINSSTKHGFYILKKGDKTRKISF